MFEVKTILKFMHNACKSHKKNLVVNNIHYYKYFLIKGVQKNMEVELNKNDIKKIVLNII